MSQANTEDRTIESRQGEELGSLGGVIDRAAGLLDAFRQDLVPYLEREAEHLDEDLQVLETWADNAEQEGVAALAGAEVVVRTAAKRIAYFDEVIGDADTGLEQRLDNLGEAIKDLEDHVQTLEISDEVYVVYVNRSFTARYTDPSVRVGRILRDDGREDVDELGLYPLDDLFGAAIPDLALPANREVDLRESNRVYWESESDGGSIA